MPAVVNIGGATIDDPELLDTVMEELEGLQEDVLVVPGGGTLVDRVRAIDRSHDLSDGTAHWAAIRCMDITAAVVADRSDRFRAVTSVEGVEAAWADDATPVLRPHGILREHDPLPASWDATSDAIAGWIAAHLGIETVVLLKRVDGIRRGGEVVDRIDADAVAGTGTDVVDPVLPEVVAEHGLRAVVMASSEAGRIRQAIAGGGIGTVIEAGSG
ncbi:MAG: hypothetical protein SVU88_00815 [Candidatus Nanohaloarchaea archaeon]|nr:hypothetical protein [Candidatus Nanohaloarchaea archaeon]